MTETPAGSPAEPSEGGGSAPPPSAGLGGRPPAAQPQPRRRRRWLVWLPRQIKWVEVLYPLLASLAIFLTYVYLTERLVNRCSPPNGVCTPVLISQYLKGTTDKEGNPRPLCAAAPLPTAEAIRLWPGRFLWVFATAALMLAGALCVIVSLHSIWKSIAARSLDKPYSRPHSRRVGAAAVGATLLFAGAVVGWFWWKVTETEFMPQMAELLGCTAQADLPSVIGLAYWTNVISVAVTACLVLASCALLVPPRGCGHGAPELAARMNRLRVLLYAGAAVLVVMVLRVRITTNWALSYLTPWSNDDAARVEAAKAIGELTSAFTTAQSASNTLMLVAVYVPALLVLRRRAAALAGRGMPPPAREEWLKERGLSFSFSEFTPRIVAILAPLLAGPLGDLFGRLG